MLAGTTSRAYRPVVGDRRILIPILVAALVALFSLAQLREVQRAGFEWTPGFITLLVLVAAIAGNRPAWALAFVVAGIGVTLGWVVALSRLDEPAHAAVAAVGTVVLISLWGLRPDEPADRG